MVAGLSDKEGQGKMAKLVVDAIKKTEDMLLWPVALAEEVGVAKNIPDIPLIPEAEHAGYLKRWGSPVDLIVDFTQPKAVNCNANLYCEVGIPFIMGTTGGERQKLIDIIKKSDISAVVATNMAPQIVMFQEMIRFAAENFPRALEGSHLWIKESHQKAKKDVSGTAISLLPHFAKLGIPFAPEDIDCERDPRVQEFDLGIPQQYLNGHGFHTYIISSSDRKTELRFEHNVLGRNVYVDGALRAIRFLAQRKGEKGKVFSMVDVLRG